MFEFLEKRKVLLIYIPLAVYWTALFVGTSLPADSVSGFGVGDKLLHFIAYFILAVLLSLTLLFQKKNRLFKKRYILFSIIISSVYGLLDEIHQSFIPGRSNEVLDWAADSIGAAAGILLVYYTLNKLGYFEGNIESQ